MVVPLASFEAGSDMANVNSMTMQSLLDMFEPLQSDLKDKSVRRTQKKRWCKKAKTCMRICKKSKKCEGRYRKFRKICKKKCKGENKVRTRQDKEKDETVSNNCQSKNMIGCTALHAYALLLP